MKEILISIRKRLIIWKVYFSRSATYLSMINTGMILIIFLMQLKDNGMIDIEISSYIFPLYIGGFIILVFIGWIEIRVLKGMENEAKEQFKLNPYLMEMRNDIAEIKKNITQSD